MNRTAVLAYSGGLDTTCIIAWLKEFYDYDEVVAVLCDVGQEFDLEQSQERGYAAGADDVLLVDRREAFANDQVAKAIQTNALYEDKYPLVSALSRPVIAQAVAELALELGAEAAVHGCTGKGNDQLRFDLAFRANYPGVRVIAPLRDKVWTRDEEIEYAQARGIPVTVTKSSPFSFDENLFGRSIEAGVLEDPWEAPPEEPYLLTSDPNNAPEPTEVVIGFEGGLPVSLDGEQLAMTELIATLNKQAGAYGIGRIDMIENRAIGIKSREVYEAPAAMTLIAAHRALEDIVLTKAELNVKRGIEDTWARTVYDGLWFSPIREALDAFVAKTQELVSGEVRVQLRPAAAVVNGRRSENALYAETLASYATGETFPHEAAAGFIEISALEIELAAARARKAVTPRPGEPGGSPVHSADGRRGSVGETWFPPRERAGGERRGRGLHQALVARSGAGCGAGPGKGGARLTLWQGRVEGQLAPEVWELVKADDAELFPYDCEGTRIHARRLAAAGLLSADELAQVEARLSELDASMIEESDEDVHSAIERLLGPVGRKIHAGRSRNDQVVTAFRLWTADACAEAKAGIEALAGVVLDRADEGAETVMPGYTHLQRAQPVTLGHHLLAWVEMLDRDRDRFALAAEHAEPSPLGAGALAGTTLPLPKVRNSLDAVADRDFALDYLYACAALFVHLSRIGEELALWATSEFGFVALPDSAATGSSMMPQKLNPDVAELARGKAGTAIGRLTGLLSTVKGLPLSYNSDLGEDKPAAFAARRDVRRVLAALAVLVRDLRFVEERLEAAAADPGLLATDAAEALVAEGVPFRDAHEQVAGAVRDGVFDPDSTAAESAAARLGDVRAAIAAARTRFQAT